MHMNTTQVSHVTQSNSPSQHQQCCDPWLNWKFSTHIRAQSFMKRVITNVSWKFFFFFLLRIDTKINIGNHKYIHSYRRQHKSLLRQHHKNNPNRRLDLIFGMIRHARWYLCVKISVLLQVFHTLRRLSVPFSVSFSFFTIEDLKKRSSSHEKREREKRRKNSCCGINFHWRKEWKKNLC